MLPDGSAGLYSRDSYDDRHEVNGVSRLVIAEIKKPGVTISMEQKAQPWKYVRELIDRGFVTENTRVDCFILGSEIEKAEAGERKDWGDRVVTQPLLYNAFVRRAEARMLGLRSKLINAPFLKEQGVDISEFTDPPMPLQAKMNFGEALVGSG